MADRRSVRSASRRKTPTPQPPSKPTAPQLGRASRARNLRSASRDIDDFVDMQKPTRRSARQTSRKPAADALGDYPEADESAPDLTVVEEIDTKTAFQDEEAPGTPEATQSDTPPFRSPGAASEMSGTTAISSFTMVEAEFLEPKFILKHMRKLCDSANEFLEHIAPDSATMGDDLRNIQEMQKPGSDYTEEYLDYEIELNVHLKHFKSEEHSYIHARALHRALFGTNEIASVSHTGLDLVLYLVNLLVFAKQMIHSNRDDKTMWDVLRQLDNTFPVQFMHSLERGAQPTAVGTSTLLQETFDLALELRTQLAVLVLQKWADDPNFNPDDMVCEIFFCSESSQAIDGSPIRGWNIAALGGDESLLPPELRTNVVKRLNDIRKYFPTDDASLRRGDLVRLEELRANFPWEPTILRLLAWARLRHRELQAAIEELGGAAAIARNVMQVYMDPQPVNEQASVPSALQESPRRKRKSFGRDRRRSSRKFDPTAAVDFRTIDVLKAREQDSGVQLETHGLRQEHVQESIQQVEDLQAAESVINPQQQDDWQPEQEEEEEQQPDEEQDEPVQEQDEPLPEREQPEPQPEEQDVIEEEQADERHPSGPPQSSADLHRLLKAASKPQKENRPVSIFDRQKTAQRVEFGDGFDETQLMPGPPNTAQGKQPAESSLRKRSRPMDDNSDSDAFESEDRGLRVPERRRNAPVSKKVRLDPSSSGVPPSHQPPQTQQEAEQEESVSEPDAPDMTEELPASTYQAQRRLAQENSSLDAPQHHSEYKMRKKWTHEAEEALCEYMSIYPGKYSTILKYDENNGRLLDGRTQVNLKDKVRNMALNMIKSGTGLRPGFEKIVHPREKYGKVLMASGWVMRADGEWERERL